MSYGHADDIAGQARTPAGGTPPVDAALLARPDVRGFLADHDIGAFYRVLIENGWSQHGIAKASGTQQSQVCEILKGRRVIDYRVLERIAQGLGIPRELMGLSYGSTTGEGAYGGGGTVTETPEGADADMLRRHLIALGGVAMAGTTVAKLG
ncbi:MAG: helix-turn-helix domain-containing protein, partial [Pseudonocardiaceae bacterium]